MTEKEKKEYHRKVNDNIRKFGYHLTFVFADKSPAFCYSTGIYKSFNIPEIFISSLPQNLSFELIKNYVELFKETKDITLNTKINTLSDRFPVYLIEVPIANLLDYVLSSIKFYKNDNCQYLQLIYPDTSGRFPKDIGYDYDQEIMGKVEY